MLEECSETCGWIAGTIGAFSFGSFGVPIKLIASTNVKVDPLVMQSYKTMASFLTCWLVIPLLGEELKFTPWGILSGLFWVPGATAGIYGIQNAGLAISVGTWSSLTVISSFSWGILVFNEKVKSISGACGAALVLIIGLVGMSIYSVPVDKVRVRDYDRDDMDDDEDFTTALLKSSSSKDSDVMTSSDNGGSVSVSADEDFDIEGAGSGGGTGTGKGTGGDVKVVEMTTIELKKKKDDIESHINQHQHQLQYQPPQDTINKMKSKTNSIKLTPAPGRIVTRRKKKGSKTKPTVTVAAAALHSHSHSHLQNDKNKTPFTPSKHKDHNLKDADDKLQVGVIKQEEEFHIFGHVRLSRRQLGIIGAVINGAWGGNNMIPLHYASKQGFHGAGYLISFSCGAMLVTVLMWGIRYLYNLYCWDFDRVQAYNALPSFHLREMWFSGSVAGGLYSLGNFCSILAVTSLGQGVGFSFVQTSMLVSGLWGIFFFGEVQGSDRISKWLLSSIATIAGILWLAYEHQGAVTHRRLLAVGM